MTVTRIHSCVQDADHDVISIRVTDLFECACGKLYQCIRTGYEAGSYFASWRAITEKQAKKLIAISKSPAE